MYITNATLILPNKIQEHSYLRIENGKIAEYGFMSELQTNENCVSLNQQFVFPGFIDEHIHGTDGVDVMDGTPEALHEISVALIREGVTSFLATTMTEKPEIIEQALKNIAYYQESTEECTGAELLGAHLEGPFISCVKSGGQDSTNIQKPTIEKIKDYQKIAGNKIKLVTYAPEETTTAFTKYIYQQGIVPSAGHSNASYQTIVKHLPYGLSNVTHIFNAMSPITHRDPGLAFASLYRNELTVEIICDGHHVDKNVIDFIYNVKGANLITLVSDSMRAKNCPDGHYLHGGQIAEKKDGCVLLPNGTICGSVLKISRAAQLFKKYTNCSLLEIAKVTSGTPAKKLAVYDRKGSIELGKDADLVVLDNTLSVKMTLAKGHILYTEKKGFCCEV